MPAHSFGKFETKYYFCIQINLQFNPSSYIIKICNLIFKPLFFNITPNSHQPIQSLQYLLDKDRSISLNFIPFLFKEKTPYIPQPLKNINETIGEKMEKDADYSILLSDINDFTISVFSNFQKQAVPIIQENYIQRNMIFQKCHDKLKYYKESYKDVESDLEEQFSIFKQTLLQHIEEVCDQKMKDQDAEIIVNRDQLSNVQKWAAEVNTLLEEAQTSINKYEKFCQHTMQNHISSEDTTLDLNFFEENARNQEKLTTLDNATTELEQLLLGYKQQNNDIQNIIKDIQQRLTQ